MLTDKMRSAILGALALCGSLLILTSGPRSVMGSSLSADAGLDARTGSENSVAPSPIDEVPEVMWDVLAGLDLSSGEASAELAPFIGKEVKVPGFMVPLEDFAEEVTEFLLVPYVGACVHTPPPPPNQLVYVTMQNEERVEVSFWEPVWIRGVLEVEETSNVYGSVSFKQTGVEVTPYEW